MSHAGIDVAISITQFSNRFFFFLNDGRKLKGRQYLINYNQAAIDETSSIKW